MKWDPYIGEWIEDEAENPWDDDEPDYPSSCHRCGGLGVIVICIDDICRGSGECMHGDGYLPCPCGADPD